MSRLSEIQERIDKKIANVVVFGMGYIGLPTALFYAEKGLNVTGLDTNADLVSDLKNGITHMEEEGLDSLASQNLPRIRLITSYEEIEKADVCVLCLPSPIDKEKKPVLRFLENSIAELGRRLKKGCLVLIESTVPVGTTERLATLFAEESRLKLGNDFWFAHCPERVLPGKVVAELETNHRLAGGVTSQSTKLATAFLSSVFNAELVHPTSARVSEAAKLAENSYRDVNVAFANELARICAELGIDVTEVIQLANLHPRVDILRPGIGVGGYCLPKDGWLLVQSIKDGTFVPRLITAARSVNDEMPAYVFSRVQELDLEALSLKPIVGLLGLSFKPNVSDTRNSPSVQLVHILLAAGMEVIVFDPYVERDYGAKRAESLDELLDACEVVILGVGHDMLVRDLVEKDLSQKVFIDPNNSMPDLKNRVKKYIGLSI